jgi:ribosomal protein S18 acetylase RimI-like enzyme
MERHCATEETTMPTPPAPLAAREFKIEHPGVSVVRQGQHREAAAAIAAGHANYPSFRHLFREPRRRERALRAFFGATVRDAIPFGSVLAVGDGGRAQATAVWLPPGAFPWSPGRKLRAAAAFGRVLLADPAVFPAFLRYGAAVERHHRDLEPHWYLVVLSVRPDWQHRGLGSRLVAPILERADLDGTPCRLETSDPDNVAFYERFGFQVVDELAVLAGGPPLISMHRPPRPGHAPPEVTVDVG